MRGRNVEGSRLHHESLRVGLTKPVRPHFRDRVYSKQEQIDHFKAREADVEKCDKCGVTATRRVFDSKTRKFVGRCERHVSRWY